MFREAIKYAWNGSLEMANSWATLIGGAILWAVLKMSGVSTESLGGGLASVVVTVAAAWAVIFLCRLLYWPWGQLSEYHKREKSDLIIRYDFQDDKCVRVRKNLYGPTGEFYSIWLENVGEKTLEKVSLWASEGRFAQHVIHPARTGTTTKYTKPVRIFEVNELHPQAPEKIELFGLSYETDSTNADYILNRVQLFTLEARAKDTKTVRKTFEYDPKKRPMILPIDEG